MTTRGRSKSVRKTGNTRPVTVGSICAPSAAASVGATSCCTAGIEYTPVFTAGPANISGIETSYPHGEPCMNATSGSVRVMKSPSRGTIRSWPVRPGKYARANISRKRCRAATSAGAVRRIRGASLPEDRSACWPETVPAIATRVRTSRTAPQAVNLEEVAKVGGGVMAPASLQTGRPCRDPIRPIRRACVPSAFPNQASSLPPAAARVTSSREHRFTTDNIPAALQPARPNFELACTIAPST